MVANVIFVKPGLHDLVPIEELQSDFLSSKKEIFNLELKIMKLTNHAHAIYMQI